MKILVINPPNDPYTEKELLIEPIDILIISTYIENLGHEVEFIDMDLKRINKNELINYININFYPDIVIIPFDYHIPLHTQETYKNIRDICIGLRKINIKTLMLGKLVTYNPNIINILDFDIGIIGEVEEILKELLCLEKINISNLKNIRNLVFKENENIVITKSIDSRINLDELPIAKREFVNIKEYIDIRSVLTSRGCINKCSFCPTSNYFGNWRANKAEKVVDEIEILVKKYNSKKIIFLDDNATVDKERIKKICNLIIDRKLNVKLGCLASINTYNYELFDLMYRAGFRWVHFGIESASQEILNQNNKKIDVALASKVIKEVKKIGFRVRTSFIFDMPGTTHKDMLKTIEFILDTQPDEIRAHFLVYRLGADIYGKVAKNKELTNQYIHNQIPVNNLKGYSQEEINKDIEFLKEKLKQRDYKIINNVSDWNDIEKLRNKEGKIKFLSFCPSKYGIDWK